MNGSVYCRKCDIDIDMDKIILEEKHSNSGIHVKASCPLCGNFIRFIPYEEPTLHFGKYNGKTVKELAVIDPEYLIWLMEQHNAGRFKVARRVREAINEILAKHANTD